MPTASVADIVPAPVSSSVSGRASFSDIAAPVPSQSAGAVTAPDSSAQPSPGLPHPDLVDQQTTTHANTLAAILLQGRLRTTSQQMADNPPGVPAPPLPLGLQGDDQVRAEAPVWINPRTGQRSRMLAPGQGGGPLSVLDSPITGGAHMGEGFEQMAEPGLRQKAGGLHKVIGGALEAASPLMVAAGAAAPLETAATLATGTAAESGIQWALKKIGIPEEYAAVAGDLLGLFAAAKTPKTIAALKAKYEPVLKARFEKAGTPAPEPAANSTGTAPYQPAASHGTANAADIISPENKTAPQGTIESPGASDGKRPIPATAAVDAGATRPLDAGATGEGPAVHGASAPGPRPDAERGRGEATDVLVPGEDRSIPAHYAVRELSDIQSSHNGQTFSANPNYQGQNERDYSKPENQQRVIEQSSEENFNPRFHITDNPDMGNGPALIDDAGNALGGNSRTMHLQRVYGRDGQQAAAYRALLEKKAPQFGIDPEAVRGMRQPVLVRVATPEGLASLPGGSKWAVRKTNITGTAALSSAERAAADAGQMSPGMIGHIAGAIENAGPDATLNDALTGKSGTAIVNRLIEDGFFSEQERPALMDGRTGALTQLAKDRISKALLGKFFRDSDQIARTPASIRNKLERVAAPLAKVAGDPAWDITPEVRDAIDLNEFAAAHGIRNLGDVVSQTGMFGEPQQWSDGAVKLAGLLRDGKPNDVVAAFRKYVNSKEPTMFGESTPAEAFRDAFGAEKPETAAAGAPPAVPPQGQTPTEGAAGEPESGPHGPILRQFHHDAAGAIAELRSRQSGDAIGALHHPEIGDIDLIWGKTGDPANDFDGGYGLAHIDAKHPGIADRLPEILPTLKKGKLRGGNRQTLVGRDHGAVVGLDWNDQAKRWLLTAYKNDVPRSEESLGGSESPRGPEGPATPSQGNSSVTLGSGLGAFEPFLRESFEDMRAMKAARDAAIEELERSKITPGEKRWGERVRHYFTSERDLWAARANQGIAKVRKLTFPARNRRTGADTLAETIAIAREFKGRPDDLKSILGGYHPDLASIQDPAEYDRVMARIQALRPQIERALEPMDAGMKAVDRFYTNMAEMTAEEGKRVGVLHTEWNPETYVPHVLNPRGEGVYPGLRKAVGRALGGDIGKHFGFSARRSYATLLDAIMHDVIPKTMNVHDAFTIQQDGFARARATRLLEDQLRTSNLGKYTVKENAPEGWLPLAPHTDEFRQLVPYDTGAIDEEGKAVLDTATKRLFVPKYIAEGLRAITAPDYTVEIAGKDLIRGFQAATKAAQLGLSFFHATTENYMALANMGPKGWAKALMADRDSPEFLLAERDLIAHGGTTSIQGNTVEAWKAMKPGSIPTYQDIWRQNALVKIMDQAAHAISDFTFANMQRRFKVTDYQLHKAAWMAEHPGAMRGEVRDAGRGIAKEVNAIYGGLHWENIGARKAGVEIARAIFLAPDWTISNVFNVKYAFEKGPAGKMARMFWARTIVGGIVATQAASLMFTRGNGAGLARRLRQDPRRALTMVYMGKDRNGEDIWQNIFFKGAPGDAINLVNNTWDYGPLEGPVRTIAAKGSPTVRTGLELAQNRGYLGGEIAPKGISMPASTARAAWAITKGLAPIPLSLTNQVDMLFGPESHKYTWPESLTTMFSGNPPSHVPPAGTHMSNGVLRPNAAREENSVVDQMRTGRVYKRRDGGSGK